MMRQIKASEVREGMEIEWTSRGWYHRGVVAAVTRNHPGGVWVQSSDGFEMSVEPDQVFTVLSEPQPDEPTAFGACVKAGEVRFTRINTRGALMPWLSDGGGTRSWNEMLSFGPVVIMCADPFANTEPREPRVWDRWADVPGLTPVCVSGIETLYRKREGRVERRQTGSWVPALSDEDDLNKRSPFTEVLDA